MEAVIGSEDGKSYQVELEEQQVQALTGLKIGDEVDGSVLGLKGYTLRITGGSDTEGFPMRASLEGTGRKKLLLEGGTGAKDLEDGERKRKSVRGNTVSGQLSQVNMKVVDAGDKDIETLLGEEPEAEVEESDEDEEGESEAGEDDEEDASGDEPDEEEAEEKTGGEGEETEEEPEEEEQ